MSKSSSKASLAQTRAHAKWFTILNELSAKRLLFWWAKNRASCRGVEELPLGTLVCKILSHFFRQYRRFNSEDVWWRVEDSFRFSRKIQNRYWRTCGSSHYYYYSFKFGDPFNGFVNFPKDSSEDNEILRASEWDEFQEWYEEEEKRMLKKKSLMKLAYNYIFLVINFCSVLVEKGLETKKCNYVEHAT